MSKYKVIPKSVSGHCCFEYSIIDSSIPDDDPNDYNWIVEGHFKEDAKWVAEALNNYNNVWHENMASEAVGNILAEYIQAIDGDLSHAFGVY